MARKLRKEYLETYRSIIFTQPLINGNWVKVGWEQEYKGDNPTGIWVGVYMTSSVYHICPFDGSFRNCVDCGALEPDFSIEFCTNKTQRISTAALIERIIDCQRAGVQVEYFE